MSVSAEKAQTANKIDSKDPEDHPMAPDSDINPNSAVDMPSSMVN